MTIDKAQLKALAEAATQSHGARRVEVDHNGVHVIGDGSWKILSAWHTPDGKGAQNAEFAAVASPATVLALLAEIDQLKAALDMESAELAWSDSDGREIQAERDKLRAELAGLRTGYDAQNSVIEDYKSGQDRYEQIIEDMKVENKAMAKALGDVMEQVDGNIRETVRDCVNGHDDVQDIYGYCDAIEGIVGAAMAKEASHG